MTRFLARLFGTRRAAASTTRPTPARTRLGLEALDGREMPAVLTMNTVVSPAVLTAAPATTALTAVKSDVAQTRDSRVTSGIRSAAYLFQLQQSVDAVQKMTDTLLRMSVDVFGKPTGVVLVPPHVAGAYLPGPDDSLFLQGNLGAVAELRIGGIDVVVAAAKGGKAVVMSGDILAKWRSLGGENGRVGLPIDEVDYHFPNMKSIQKFQYGTLFQTQAGTFALSSASVTRYFLYESLRPGSLGRPTADTQDLSDGGAIDRFEKGVIYSGYASPSWDGVGGVVTGRFVAEYERLSGPKGWLGYPMGAPELGKDGVTTTIRFQHGELRWNPSTGFVAVRYDVWDAVRLDLWH